MQYPCSEGLTVRAKKQKKMKMFEVTSSARCCEQSKRRKRCKANKPNKTSLKAFFAANDIDPRDVPEELQGLTQVGGMALALVSPSMRVSSLKEEQKGYESRVMNLAQSK